MFDLDAFWEALLSEDPAQIRAAWTQLDPAECQAVLAHLQQMATESGWSLPQQRSAATALQVLTEPTH